MKIATVFALLLIGNTMICHAALSTVNLFPFKDAYVYFSDLGCSPSSCYRQNENYGDGSTLHLASYHLDTRGLLGFNIANISGWNSQSSIVSAVLYLPPLTLSSIAYVNSQCTINIIALANTWREHTVTANTLPAVNTTFSYTITNSAFAAPNSVSVDITDYVQSVVVGIQTRFSLILTSNTNCAIPSRESGAAVTSYVTVVVSKASRADNIQCDVGWAVCNSTCFDPSLYDCVDATPNPGQTLCPKGLGFCNGGCYNRSTHMCIADRICPTGSGLCNSHCYNTTAYECFSGMLCARHNQRCGNACFDPAAYTCVGGTVQQK